MEIKKPKPDDWYKHPTCNYLFSGLFYLHNEKKVPCRRELHIRKEGSSEPDLLVIMMNPGSSRPKAINQCSELRQELCNQFVPTEPDDTQWQIIEFMESHSKHFKYARVLNLSDVCKSKSADLRALDTKFSIFTQNVKSLDPPFPEHIFNSPHAVLLAWGCKSIFSKQITNVLELLETKKFEKRFGYPTNNQKHDGKNYFYHPLPPNKNKQEDWIKKVGLLKNEDGKWVIADGSSNNLE